jgi:predicted CopG family antitoxin
MSMVKTTLSVRDDIYARLRQMYGPRGVSKAVNEILLEHLSHEKSMFGTMKKADISDVRDHRDRT